MVTAAGPVVAASIAPAASPSGCALGVRANAEMLTPPAGFPPELKGAMSWTGSDFTEQSTFVLTLGDRELAEINAAVIAYKCKQTKPTRSSLRVDTANTMPAFDQDGDLVERKTFPLPTLGPKLEEMSHDIHHGKGFGVVRGIDPTLYSVEDLALVYLGVQCYIAEQRGRQDRRGNMLGQSSTPSCGRTRLTNVRKQFTSLPKATPSWRPTITGTLPSPS